jgi:protein-tyrosine phosphatase
LTFFCQNIFCLKKNKKKKKKTFGGIFLFLLLAMAMPGEGLQSAFRNSLDDVAGMLESEHGKNYMVYNLSEKEYDTSKLNDQVLDFGWPDHQAPPLKLLFALCKSIDSWLKSDSKNVVAIHCKGGKGRTGTVICSYFLYSGLCKSPEEAMDLFGSKRMAGEKIGVTQPSQRRLAHYSFVFLTNTNTRRSHLLSSLFPFPPTHTHTHTHTQIH